MRETLIQRQHDMSLLKTLVQEKSAQRLLSSTTLKEGARDRLEPIEKRT